LAGRPPGVWGLKRGEKSPEQKGRKLMMASVRIGTSGWHYNHWRARFYPEDMASAEMLAFYARRFPAVEINNSFYKLPQKETFENWRGTVPDGFIFAVKASRYITHMKKLKEPEEPVRHFLERIAGLGNRLGPVLFQLPPNWHCNPDRLRAFVGALPDENRYAFEFRDPSWFTDEIFRILEEAGAAFCIYDLEGRLSPKPVTADFIYVRLHGPGSAYEGNYSPEFLSGRAGAFSTWQRQGKDIFCFFDNDQKGFAAANAMSLLEMLNQR
jgi:uncharacterized protein YecE (DUF72 family)